MSVLDPELADGLHNSRSGHGSRLGSSARLTRGSGSNLPSRASSSASLAPCSTAGGSSGDLLGVEQALGHSHGRDVSAGGGAAGPAVVDPFAASAEAPFVHAGDLHNVAPQTGAQTGRSAASSMQADAGGASGAALDPPHLPMEAAAPCTASALASQADGQSPERQLSRCLSDDSDVEEDRQRLRAAQWQAAEASNALQRPANPQAAGASTDTTVANHDEPSVVSSMPDGSGDLTSAAAVAQMQQRDGGHFEVAAPLPGDAEPQQNPLQQAFRAAQAQLQKPQRVRLPTVAVAADQSCLNVCSEWFSVCGLSSLPVLPQGGPAPTVVEAVWELLDAGVAGPRLDSGPEGSARRRRNAQKFSDWRPAARWYDARCVPCPTRPFQPSAHCSGYLVHTAALLTWTACRRRVCQDVADANT
jgi:hypothetical protein